MSYDDVNQIEVTRYRSEETLTRMRSSPTRTFSPSDLCLEAGWMVHQQASPVTDRSRNQTSKPTNVGNNVKSDAAPPVESSCKPTSKANLSVSEREVVKQLRYCSVKKRDDMHVKPSETRMDCEDRYSRVHALTMLE